MKKIKGKKESFLLDEMIECHNCTSRILDIYICEKNTAKEIMKNATKKCSRYLNMAFVNANSEIDVNLIFKNRASLHILFPLERLFTIYINCKCLALNYH